MEKIPEGKRIFYLKVECEDSQVETLKILLNDLNTVLPEGNQIITGVEYKNLQDLFNEQLDEVSQHQTVRDLYAAIKAAMEHQKVANIWNQPLNPSVGSYLGFDTIEVKEEEEKDKKFDFNFRGRNFRVSEAELKDPNSKNLGDFLRMMAKSTNKKKGA
jgi:hypothetical protein